MIELTSIYIRLLDEPYTKIKAYVDIVLDGVLAVHDLTIKEKLDGTLHVYFPNNIKRKTIAHPLSDDLRKHIEINVLNKYEFIRSKYGESISRNN